MEKSNHITWDQYFMSIALVSAMRSKDPRKKVGACIVDPNKRIASVGYNGFPNGCSDDIFPWNRSDDKTDLNAKHPYVVHAELNAILNSKSSLKDSTLYVTLFPCNECAKAIIQSGVKCVIYKEEPNDEKKMIASKLMFDAAGIDYFKYDEVDTIKIKIKGE